MTRTHDPGAGRSRAGVEGAELGLYREEGSQYGKPAYNQVGGSYRLASTTDGRWVVAGKEEEGEEVFIQHNPALSSLCPDRWRYPSHKASLVHTVPCCKILVAAHTTFTLTDQVGSVLVCQSDERCAGQVREGRGVWVEPGGGAVQFEGGLWRMGPGRPAGSSSALPALSSSTALCPDQAATLIPFSSGADTLHLACLQEVGL